MKKVVYVIALAGVMYNVESMKLYYTDGLAPQKIKKLKREGSPRLQYRRGQLLRNQSLTKNDLLILKYSKKLGIFAHDFDALTRDVFDVIWSEKKQVYENKNNLLMELHELTDEEFKAIDSRLQEFDDMKNVFYTYFKWINRCETE